MTEKEQLQKEIDEAARLYSEIAAEQWSFKDGGNLMLEKYLELEEVLKEACAARDHWRQTKLDNNKLKEQNEYINKQLAEYINSYENDIEKLKEENERLKEDKKLINETFQLKMIDYSNLANENYNLIEQNKKLRDALEFYAKLPLSEQDQHWTQELADQCISIAKQTLAEIEGE